MKFLREFVSIVLFFFRNFSRLKFSRSLNYIRRDKIKGVDRSGQKLRVPPFPNFCTYVSFNDPSNFLSLISVCCEYYSLCRRRAIYFNRITSLIAVSMPELKLLSPDLVLEMTTFPFRRSLFITNRRSFLQPEIIQVFPRIASLLDAMTRVMILDIQRFDTQPRYVCHIHFARIT